MCYPIPSVRRAHNQVVTTADGKGPSYTYTPDGKLASRLWARGVLTSYSYDRVGSLVGIDYSDNTPDIVYTYDRLGNRISAVNSVSTNLFVYSSQTMDLVSEAQNGALITRSVDAVGRSVGLEMGNNYAVTYGYDNFGRFSSVSSSICSVSSVASYAWFLGSDVVSGYSDGPLTVTRTFEPNRDRIAQIRNETSPGGIVSQYDYINDVMGRRVSRYDSGFAFDQSHPNIFSYNQRSEVIGVVMNTNIYGYVYDCTGTRLFSFANGKTNIYAANSLNQYTNIIHCSSSITHFSYDTDGNMLTNGVWSYTWDGENRLTFMASNSILVVSNLYDPMSRRFAKSSSGETRIFFYDGWSVICESVDRQGQKTNTNYYVWGLDLDGTMQGSGGIGGLLESSRCISTNSQQSIADSFFCCYDANGNITEYTDEKGVICGHIEYDAFGNKAMMCENILNVFPFKFSTKIFDDENALYYYGYRYYSPEEGSFISRDPLSQVYERAIYRFVNNNTFNLVDLYGLISDEACQKSADNFMNNPGAYSAILRQVLEEIGKIKGCNPLKPKCKCCTGDSSDSWGEVSGDGKILTICSNNMETRDGSTATQRMLETLAHENIHVLQNCRKQDKQSCAGAACAEIQAWLHDGTCHRIAPGAVRKCVIDGAASSAKNRCNNNLDEARRQVEALYEKCNLPVGQGPNF